MVIFKQADELTTYLSRQRKDGKQTGFVPTMGALHAGHISLVRAARAANDITIASIFVNPTQFNNSEDFKHYPVTTAQDIEQLTTADCDVLFLPSADEIYPQGYEVPHYELGPIENLLEGRYRPGHFQGVCQVVDRLLQIVQPHRLYLGQKDLQQCLVVRKLLELTGRDTELQFVPTEREPDGLAMSSRNLRLTEEQRRQAPAIYETLRSIQAQLGSIPFEQLQKGAEETLTQKGFVVDYVAIANATNLSPATRAEGPLAILAAASLGNVRLIDNLLFH